MTQSVAEVLILAINALGTGILMFVAGVAQRIMDDLDELEFKQFMNRLGGAAMSDPFAVTVATLPIIAAVVYFIAYGFGHWWFTAGFVVWFAGSAVTKVTNMPIYNWLADPANTDRRQLNEKRRNLGRANKLRAWLTLGSVLLMACQFGVLEVAVVTAACIVIVVPLLLLARRYTPTSVVAASR